MRSPQVNGPVVWPLLAAVALALIVPCAGAQESVDSRPTGTSPADAARHALDPMVLGPRAEIGKESLGSKAAKGILGGLLGGSSKRSGDRPRTHRDPTRKRDYALIEGTDADLEIGARAAWQDGGLLVSSYVDESDQQSTFQQVFLQDCAGRRLYPASLEIYKLWPERSFSVSWSRTRTVDGRVVGQESGGFGDTSSDRWAAPGADVAGMPGIWQQTGYARAHAGVRQLGTRFNVGPEDVAAAGLALVVHVTLPEEDPVVTRGFAWQIAVGTDDRPVVAAQQDLESWRGACAAEGATSPPGEESVVPAGTEVAAAGATVATSGAPAGAEDHTTRAGPDDTASDRASPCVEALLQIEQARQAFLAKLDDPLRLLGVALQAAADLGAATRAKGIADADMAAEQAELEQARDLLDAWDQWFNEKQDQLERHREDHYGSREPSWATGSRQRAQRKHDERTAALRQEVTDREQSLADAEQAAAVAAQALDAAQARFDAALADFRRALAALRQAKDRFADLVIRHYRCSPCEAIAGHWASAARLQDLLDRLRSILAAALARVDARLPAAQQQTAAAAAAADQARQRLNALQSRQVEIEQELRDAVDTSDGCLSLEPREGWGWMNLASMNATRGTVVPEGGVMAWRSRFNGADVRVWTKPGCIRSKIEEINWRQVNALNEELADLQTQLDEAHSETVGAERAAGIAQAAVDGLQVERDALDALQRALAGSGLDENTEAVMGRLDELSADCEQELKSAIRGAADARKRQHDAEGRIAGAAAKRDALRRRAGKAADELDDVDTAAGSDEDRAHHDELKRKADELADDSGDETPAPTAGGGGPPPEAPEDAAKRRQDAEDAADAAEDAADALEDAVSDLEDEVQDLEDEVDALKRRLAAWRRYHAAMAAYEDCLRKKQAAVEELAKLKADDASALQELARRLGEAADGVSEAAGALGELGAVNEQAQKASEKAGDLADKLERIGNAMEVIDAVMRADELTPSEKLEAMSKAFEELREWLPELPGVTQMLEFYNEAMKAIAGALSEIEDRLTQQWADLVVSGVADPEDAPIGIREEVRKAARIRELMRIVSRPCGNPPQPPAVLAD